MPRHMTPAERDECISLFRNGTTADALAERYDRDIVTVRRLIARRGAKRGKYFRTPPGPVIDSTHLTYTIRFDVESAVPSNQ